MSNPWDELPRREKGDSDPRPLLQAVGSALSQWEMLEEIRSVYFTTLLHSFTGAAGMAYGSIQSPAGRANLIIEAAKVTLRGSPLLANVLQLMSETEKMAGRRNDIAHGIVRETRFSSGGESKTFGFYLTPASYNSRKYRARDEAAAEEIRMAVETCGYIHIHKYAYTAEDVEIYATHFADLKKRLGALLVELTRFCRERHEDNPPQPDAQSTEP